MAALSGDLVFSRGLRHMGMYIGGGNFIHAPRTGDVVKISSLSESYSVANRVGARRVLSRVRGLADKGSGFE